MKRVISITLAALLFAAVFSGCRGEKSQSSVAQPTAPSTGTSSAGSPGAKVNLTFWHYFTNEGYDAMVKQIKKYDALPTAKATITEQYIPRTDLLKKYTLGIVSNDLPDLAMVDNPDSCAFASMGMFVDITDRFNAWSDNKYQPGPLNSGKYKDRQYTLPIKSNCIALWANDEMLKAAGIDKIPTTWDELNDANAKLKKTNPNVYPIAFSAIKTEEETFQLLPFVQSAGATVETLDSPEGIKALTFLSNLVKNQYASAEVLNWTQNDAAKQFMAGNAAMVIMTPNQIANAKKTVPDFKYTVSYLPKDKNYASSLGGENMGITKKCKDVDAAWDFMTTILSTDNNIEYNIEAATISPHSNATADMQYPNNPAMKVYVDQLAYAVPRGPHPKWNEISVAIQIAIQESITGAKTPEAAAKDAAAKIAQINTPVK